MRIQRHFSNRSKRFLAIACACIILMGINTNISSALSNQKIESGSSFLNSIKSSIQNSQGELQLLRNNKIKLKSKINETEVNAKNLQSQLDNLDNLIQSYNDKMQAIRLLIAKYENEIDVLRKDFTDSEQYLRSHIQVLDETLLAYYKHSNSFFAGDDASPKLLAFLAYGETTSAVLKEDQYMLSMKSAVQSFADDTAEMQNSLDEKEQLLDSRINTLNELKKLLSLQNKGIVAAHESKQRLLEETRGKQIIYETLLKMSQQEEEQVSFQIDKLKGNFAFFQSKLDSLKGVSNSDSQPSATSLSLNDNGDYVASSLQGLAPLAWPVSPSQGLSATFHDSAYQKAMGIVHNAIDIRLAQGSQVRSAADGVVTKTADNGFAYSYIIIAHPDNVLTLYGHMTEILVKEGDIVHQGDVIGLSGGMPGTKGAGWLTTGPHLHFEVFKDWKHVDPLEYLPLELIPIEFLPDQYAKKLAGENGKVKRTEEK